MISKFIMIRFKQLYRSIKGGGLIRILLSIGLIGYFMFLLFLQTANYPGVYYVSGAYFLIVALIHIKRQDLKFLMVHFANHKLILLSEYFILSIPILLILLYYSYWHISLIYLLMIVLLLYVKIRTKQRNLNTKIQKLIPEQSFEWKAGIRKYFYTFVFLWFIGITGAFFFATVPVVLFVLGIVTVSFYEKAEPLQMLLSFEMGTKDFLFHKLKTHIIIFSVLSSPLILSFVVLHTERWYIPIIEYLVFISLHIYVVLTKYAFFEPDIKQGGSQLIGAFGITALFIPIFIPALWMLSIYFYLKSKETLNFYLNDYN